jgi:hypothetical protein
MWAMGDAAGIGRSGARLVIVLVLWASAPRAARCAEVDTLLFGSLDAGRPTFVTAGAKIGLPALDTEGFVALASLGAGRRDAGRSSGDGGRHYTFIAAAVVGYQWFFDWGTAALLAGPEGWVDLAGGRLSEGFSQPQIGIRLHGEIWARPTESTLVQATAIAGSARASLWTRVAWGYSVLGAYWGPELSAYGDATGYRKWGLGLHATAYTLGACSLRGSVGLMNDRGPRGPSPYVALAVWSPW